jgi:hypothetical protein
MGKHDEEKPDDEFKQDPAPHFVNPDTRRNIKSRTRATRASSHVTTDVASIANAIAKAHEGGGSTARLQTDVLVNALDAAHKTIKQKDDLLSEKDVKIQKLIDQLAKAAEANVTQQLLEGKARLEETNSREMHESIRTAIRALGPAALPIVQRVMPYLLPSAGDVADKGDKDPRSCAIRVFAKLQDGSAESTQLLGILEMFAGDDWHGLLMFLATIANAPASAPATH